MKFNELADSILKEANLDAMSPEERDAYELELDKKEAYKASLAGHNSDDEASAHLERVYQAVKDGEWSFEDFKDFVSVVRNEAKIRD